MALGLAPRLWAVRESKSPTTLLVGRLMSSHRPPGQWGAVSITGGHDSCTCAGTEERIVITIIVVDDAPEVRDVVTTLLADEGYAVTVCDRAEAALARLSLSTPDLLILDGRLPGV